MFLIFENKLFYRLLYTDKSYNYKNICFDTFLLFQNIILVLITEYSLLYLQYVTDKKEFYSCERLFSKNYITLLNKRGNMQEKIKNVHST